jgi:RNA polymerase sigma-B factor
VTDVLLTAPSPADAELRELAALPASDPRRAALRDRVVELHLPLVRYLALRYRDLGEPLEDLVQVGTIGLINAVDRFDPSRGTELASYATPTILGEIKRHFRDRAWAVRVPRRLQELQNRLAESRRQLTQQLGRSPTVHELAAQLCIADELALDALEAQQAYSLVSLETPEHGLAGRLALVDPALEDVVDRESLRPLLHRLPEREKRILVLRFFRGLTQSEIAQELGISQMHVSRLLARTVEELRHALAESADAVDVGCGSGSGRR